MPDRLPELEQLVAILRGPDGCPWDREQGLDDLRAYLLEEAHETAAAIDTGTLDEVRGELGDLLFQIVFAAKLCEEKGAFDLEDVTREIRRKMIQRHPHVFGDHSLEDSAAVRAAWESRKAERGKRSVLEGVPASMPTLLAAYRMTQKAAAVGFDWPDIGSIIRKVEEEIDELRREIAAPAASSRIEAITEEVGDLLFTVANLARRLEVDPDAALGAANRKFRRRFERVEQKLADRGTSPGEATLDELDRLWEEVKSCERRQAADDL